MTYSDRARRMQTRRWWLRNYLGAERGSLSAGFALMVARSGVLLLLPWPLKFIIDNVIFRHRLTPMMAGILPDPAVHQMQLLNMLVLSILLLGLVDAALVYLGNRLLLDAGQRVVFLIRFDLFAHLQRMSLEYHRRNRGGELMARLGGDVRQLQEFIAAIGIDFLPHAVTIIGIATVMFIINWRFALFVLAVAPILFLLARFYANRLRASLREVRQHEGNLWSVAQEIFGSVQVVQAFTREQHEDDRFCRLADTSLSSNLEANEVQAQFGPAISLVIAVTTAMIAWYGATSVIRGSLTAGEMLVVLAYLNGMATPARQLAKTGRVFGRSIVALERIGECRAERPSVVDAADAVAPGSCAGHVEFRGVGFAYHKDESILSDISFVMKRGQTVALVGETGSGKSTIANLIPRFYDPDQGRILLDGRDLRTLPLAYLRRQIALVLQEPLLFQATVWENIAYGRSGAGREEAIAAARAVGVDDVIEKLPDGFDSMVSERGLTLSGGQRQCIAIARAMLCEAPVVILDEPSSSLDASTEHRLMCALGRLSADRTALVIAHRLETVMHADLILVLNRGRIVERGTHAELLATGRHYAQFWHAKRDPEQAPQHELVSQ
jgi:ATP-binding cassette subfamily B protein/subfamily B ATP-binding cassette protein MsbA